MEVGHISYVQCALHIAGDASHSASGAGLHDFSEFSEELSNRDPPLPLLVEVYP